MTLTERAQVWQRHITDWQVSGVSGSAYCKQQSLVYHQFVYWHQKLTQTEDCPKQAQASTSFVEPVHGVGQMSEAARTIGQLNNATLSTPVALVAAFYFGGGALEGVVNRMKTKPS
jgi:hypothetical protein